MFISPRWGRVAGEGLPVQRRCLSIPFYFISLFLPNQPLLFFFLPEGNTVVGAELVRENCSSCVDGRVRRNWPAFTPAQWWRCSQRWPIRPEFAFPLCKFSLVKQLGFIGLRWGGTCECRLEPRMRLPVDGPQIMNHLAIRRLNKTTDKKSHWICTTIPLYILSQLSHRFATTRFSLFKVFHLFEHLDFSCCFFLC